MPTGYTAGVADGTITDFATYALQCARAFGATIMLRDEPLSADIPEFEPSDHYKKGQAEAERELSEFLAMSPEQQRELHAAEHAKNVATADEGLAKMQEERDRYEAMLVQAKSFAAPSPEHENYARFIVSQLEESISFDCNPEFWENQKKPIPFEEWKQRKLDGLHHAISWRAKAAREEVDRTEGRNRWVRQLREAIAAVEQPVNA